MTEFSRVILAQGQFALELYGVQAFDTHLRAFGYYTKALWQAGEVVEDAAGNRYVLAQPLEPGPKACGLPHERCNLAAPILLDYEEAINDD